VSLRAGLYTLEKRKVSCPCQDLKQWFLLCPVPSLVNILTTLSWLKKKKEHSKITTFDSSDSTVTGYQLDNMSSVPSRGKTFFIFTVVKTKTTSYVCGVHPAPDLKEGAVAVA
jgi:hypothetical protein